MLMLNRGLQLLRRLLVVLMLMDVIHVIEGCMVFFIEVNFLSGFGQMSLLGIVV